MANPYLNRNDVRNTGSANSMKSGGRTGERSVSPGDGGLLLSPVRKEYRKPPIEALPDVLEKFIRSVAKSVGCDESYPLVAVLSIVAGCIGNSRVAQVRKGWHVPSAFWGGIIGESGQMKSPVFSMVTAPLYRIQEVWFEEFQREIAQFSTDEARYEMEHSEWKRSKGEGDPPIPPKKPVCQRLLMDDVTAEKLAVMLQENERGLLAAVDELAGLLGGFNKYRNGKGSDESKYLSMHDGKSLVVDRKSSETIYVQRALLSILGGTQPEVIKRLLGQEGVESGLAQRFCWVYPPRRPKTYSDHVVPDDVQEGFEKVIRGLLELPPIMDDSRYRPLVVPFTDDALDLWKDFVNEWGQQQYQLNGPLASCWSKLEGYAARIALMIEMVQHVSGKSDGLQITRESLSRAITLVIWFGEEQYRIYSELFTPESTAEIDELVALIASNGGRITPSGLMDRKSRFKTADSAEKALNNLVRQKLGHWEVVKTKGRPRTDFVLDGFQSRVATPEQLANWRP